jgi:two-component system OmpR family response regulator
MCYAGGRSVEKRILIVVRDRDERELLSRALAGRGFQVSVASDAVGGLFQLGLSQPDLIILDANGWELLQRIRALSDIPIIVIIEDRPLLRIESLNLGADYFVVKPASLLELDAKVRALFRSSRSRLANAMALD